MSDITSHNICYSSSFSVPSSETKQNVCSVFKNFETLVSPSFSMHSPIKCLFSTDFTKTKIRVEHAFELCRSSSRRGSVSYTHLDVYKRQVFNNVKCDGTGNTSVKVLRNTSDFKKTILMNLREL